MRVSRTFATAGLTLAALGLAGTASIASAAPSAPAGAKAVSTDGGAGQPEIRAASQGGGGQVLAFAQGDRNNFHP
ncbi:hypothetical protein [Streptomyces sp. NPDC001568]|uniref:hypothetical protein n=1 Tax=Streptomyces sp. NPDC001568 TaxID=3364588 RepID=UPI003686BDE3